MQAATKAERSIKAAKDQLKKRLLQQAAAQTKKGKDDAAAGRLAIFDQGVEAATQLQRLSMDDVSKKTDMSFDVPFVVQGTDWLAKAVESVTSQLDGFAASFDIARTQRTALRASKVVDDDSATQAWFNLFKETKALVSADSAGVALKKQLVQSMFAIDVNYDKVTCEACSLAGVRLTLKGTRSLIATSSFQLQHFMERKGVPQPIPVPRQAAFFRSMNPDVIQEYVKECSLWAGTLVAGDLLYLPFGAIVGEKVTELTQGLRLPMLTTSASTPNLDQCLQAKKEELEKVIAAGNDEAKTKAQGVLDVVADVQKACLGPP